MRGKYNSWKELKSLKTEEEKAKWIKNFCDKHGITSPKQLNMEYKGLYMYFCELSEENKDIIFPDRERSRYDIWLELRNLETENERVKWIKNFCDKHGITSPRRLHKKFSGVFYYYCELSEENKDIIFPNRCKHTKWEELRNFKTENERVDWIKNFCDKHGITSPKQLFNKSHQVFKYYCDFSEENKEKIFSHVKSRGEETLGKLLTEGEYIFTTQKDFPDLKSNKGRPLYYDVFIPSKNCLVEYHGEQHFDPKSKYYSKEGIERDRIKYQYAIDHKINICYITECKIEYEEHGYFISVFTDWNEAMEYIDSLPDVIVDAENTAQN